MIFKFLDFVNIIIVQHINLFILYLKSVKYFFYLIFKYKNLTFISLGPGFTIIFCILSKIFSLKFIHIESCCRFYSKSFTGKYCSNFTDLFFVQNRSCLKLYRNAIYLGNVMSTLELNKVYNINNENIFVTVGTTSFNSLIQAINRLDTATLKMLFVNTVHLVSYQIVQ